MIKAALLGNGQERAEVYLGIMLTVAVAIGLTVTNTLPMGNMQVFASCF